MNIRPSDHDAQRAAVALDQETSLAPGLAPVRGIPPDEVPPDRAFPIAPSADCHSHATPFSSSHRWISTAQTSANTPFSTHL